MALLWRRTHRKQSPGDEWIRREFAQRGLVPPDCTPEALARALEHERHITIEIRAHESDDPGVYGLVYRTEGRETAYIILYRPTHSLALRRLTLFHELAHIVFEHELIEMGTVEDLRAYTVSSPDEAHADAFAVGAMQYSFLHDWGSSAEIDDPDDDVSDSEFGQFLKKTRYQL